MSPEEATAEALQAKQPFCRGCRDDFYNEAGNAMNGKHCWSLPDAQVVTRFRIGWWTAPTVPRAYEKVTTLSCHHAPGKYAMHKELPEFVKVEDVVNA